MKIPELKRWKVTGETDGCGCIILLIILVVVLHFAVKYW